MWRRRADSRSAAAETYIQPDAVVDFAAATEFGDHRFELGSIEAVFRTVKSIRRGAHNHTHVSIQHADSSRWEASSQDESHG